MSVCIDVFLFFLLFSFSDFSLSMCRTSPVEPIVLIQSTAIAWKILVYAWSSVHTNLASSFGKHLIFLLHTRGLVYHPLEHHNKFLADFIRNRRVCACSNTVDYFVPRALPRSMYPGNDLISSSNAAIDRRSPRRVVASQAPVH